uniref:Uncharacterized protein n=1 Tax=Octopus bimaculoides TaxID=37653 RepID=A0A0L8GGI6_OCTBM
MVRGQIRESSSLRRYSSLRWYSSQRRYSTLRRYRSLTTLKTESIVQSFVQFSPGKYASMNKY